MGWSDGIELPPGGAAGNHQHIKRSEFPVTDILPHDGHKFRLGGAGDQACQMKDAVAPGTFIHQQPHFEFFGRSRVFPGRSNAAHGKKAK